MAKKTKAAPKTKTKKDTSTSAQRKAAGAKRDAENRAAKIPVR